MDKNKIDCNFLYDTYGNRHDFIIMEIEKLLYYENSYLKEMSSQDFLEIIYIVEGEGIYYTDLDVFEVKKGDICFVSNFKKHRFGSAVNMKGYVINFRSNFLTKFIMNHLFIEQLSFFKTFTKHNVLNNKIYDNRVENAIQKILYEFEFEIIKDVNLIRIYLLEILLTCKYQINKREGVLKENTNSNILLEKFEQLIEKYFFKYKFPKDYAKYLMVTPNYLNNICRRFRGQSAGDLIRDRILLESKRLLTTTNLSANQIAYRLNFKDSSYFTRFFKKHVHLTPAEFRRIN